MPYLLVKIQNKWQGGRRSSQQEYKTKQLKKGSRLGISPDSYKASLQGDEIVMNNKFAYGVVVLLGLVLSGCGGGGGGGDDGELRALEKVVIAETVAALEKVVIAETVAALETVVRRRQWQCKCWAF